MSQHTQAAPEFDPGFSDNGERQDVYSSERARPVPRISIQAFCDDVSVANTIQFAAEDRRLSKAHVSVHMGGIAAAISHYVDSPTPNLIILDCALDSGSLLAELDRLAESCDPGTKVVVIGRQNDVMLYRELLKRGVGEYLVAPVDPLAVMESISNLYNNPETDPVGHVFAFVGAKGGVGSSTVCHNVGWTMSEILKTDVAIADLDLAFGTTGLDFNQDPVQGIAEALAAPERLDDQLLDRLMTKCSEHLSIFAAPVVIDRDYEISPEACDTVLDIVRQNVPLVAVDLPHGWSPHLRALFALARRNAPLAGADALEWGTRNVDRFILGLMFAPKIVGIYYMAQQVASLPQKLKTSFDPILGPVITRDLASDNRTAIAEQVRQVAFWIIAAQGGLALMGSIPGEAVMGIVGPQFVAGTAALAFLLTAEVLASTGAVCESALVYMARHRNLMISAAMLSFQVVLSFALIFAMRALGWPVEWQAAGPAVALMLSLALTSVIKARVLGRLLRAPVSPLRWPLLWAALAAIAMGGAFTMLPHEYEWAQVVIGIPAIAATYLFILWRRAFGPADRALFSKMPRADEATLPNVGAMTR